MISQSSTRVFARILVGTVLLYLVSRYFIFWHGWPDLAEIFQGLFSSKTSLEGSKLYQGIALIMLYIAALVLMYLSVKKNPNTSLTEDATKYQALAYYIVRAAFWGTFLVGMADAIISLMRVEEVLVSVVGEDTAQLLGQSTQRGFYVHYPLIALGFIIAAFTRSLGFIWLAFLVVLAEFTIVITRFIFSYEQAWMGDLVRFWYAAFFLFASAYTLVENGHVRVDVLYSQISKVTLFHL